MSVAAMSTGRVLKSKFQTLAKGARGEIALFRAFIRAFNALGHDAISKEFHGNKYQVKFSNGRGAGRTTPRCELCDVAIIQYQAGKAASARIAFNQAKVTSKHFVCSSASPESALYRFSADLEQWDLLSNRPHLSQAVSTFLPPKTLLSDAILPSVGSFGVFYPSGSSFEYAYFVADGLCPLTNNAGKSGVLYLTKPLFEQRKVSGFSEVSGTCCLQTFGNALDSGLIGTPISKLINHSAHGDEIKCWLAGLLAQLQQDNPDSELPNELLSGLELAQVANEIDGDDASRNTRLKAVAIVRTNSRRR